MNKLIMMGRLTKDPEVRYGSDGKAIARFSLAVDRRYKDNNGNYPTDFFNLVSFGKTAEFVEKYLHKGVKILVEGEIRNNNYQKDGKTVYSDQIIANSVEFCESRNSQTNTQADTQTDNDGFQVMEGVTDEQLPFV